MAAPDPKPGRFWNWILTVLLPGGRHGLEGQTIRGDLLEEFRGRAARDGLRAARRWHRQQARSLAATSARRAAGRFSTSLFHDIRIALRGFRSHAAVSIAIVLTVGLAVAANAALFSVIDGLLFRPLPYREADRLVDLRLAPAALTSVPRRELQAALSRAATTPSLVERVDAGPTSLFDAAGPAVQEWGLRPADVSPNAFDMLGVYPVVGRPFVESDAQDAPFTVLLGYDIWQARFGGDPSIVGRRIEIPGTDSRDRWYVVGVMPQGFSFPDGANFWIPTYRFYPTPPVLPYARLAPGVTVEALRAELPHLDITPLREAVTPGGARPLVLLLAASVLLLLVAWIQIAGLLVARATGRTTEIGVRLALGAGRWRLLRQFAVESALLIAAALAVALLAAPAITAAIVRFLPPEITRGQYLDPDLRVFAFTAVLSALGLAAFTLLPADLLRRASPVALMRRGDVGDVRLRATIVRRALFVGQLATASALIYLAALAVQSYAAVTHVSPGFEAHGVYGIKMPRGQRPVRPAPGMSRTYLDRQRAQVDETIAALRELPEVLHAGGSHFFPFDTASREPAPVPSESDPSRQVIHGRYETIGLGFASTLGISIVEGGEPSTQELSGTDHPPALQLALVNETLARHLARFGPPIGQVVAVTSNRRYRVTGVMADARIERLDRPPEPTIFGLLPPPAAVGVVFVRLRPGVSIEATGVQATLDRIWGSVAPRPEPLEAAVHRASGDYRARTLVLGMICLLTLPLTLIGVAGAITYATRQRTRELAIELAIGAEPGQIERRIIGQALSGATVGLVVGLGAGILLGRAMAAALFGVGAIDPSAIMACSVVIVLAVCIAAWMPARWAGRIDLAGALRDG